MKNSFAASAADMSRLVLAGTSLSALLAGCASYEPKPIDPQAQSQEFELRALAAGPWRLEALQSEAVRRHPDAAGAAARRQAAEAAIISAGARPNPAFSASAQNNASAEPGALSWTYGLGVDMPLEVAGKRDLRLARATWLALAAEQTQTEALWRIQGRARDAYFAAAPIDRMYFERARIHEDLAKEIDRRLAAGMVGGGEALQARLAARQAQLAANDTQRRREEGLRKLAAATGLPARAIENAELPFDDLGGESLPDPDDVAKIARDALRVRPDVLAALAEYEASQAALQLEIARQYPDVSIGPGYTWDAGALKWSLGLALNIPIFDRNRGPIAEAQARRKEAAAAFRAVQEQAIAEIFDAQSTYGQVLRQLRATERIALDQRVRQRAADAAFQAGAVDRLALLAARLEAAAAETALEETRLDAHRSVGRVEDALRRTLAPNALKGQP